MTSSTRVRGVTRWSSPRTSIVTSTSFQACTKDAAVAWRKRSCETIRAWESKGCRYSPICSQTQATYSSLWNPTAHHVVGHSFTKRQNNSCGRREHLDS